MNPFLFAANWKMYLSLQEELAFIAQHKDALATLAQSRAATIALFPSFLSLQAIGNQLHNTPLKLGAQDCSEHEKGAFTGQIAASSLAQAGCSYAIIGHSERRIFHEAPSSLAQKAAQLFKHNLCPIICIGETEQEYAQKKTIAVLTQQLAPLLKVIATTATPFYLAYEPVWAIGTGKAPAPQEIGTVFEHLRQSLHAVSPHHNGALLYGGSITSSLAPSLRAIPYLEGFLIGGASIDFQEFKKIVLSQQS